MAPISDRTTSKKRPNYSQEVPKFNSNSNSNSSKINLNDYEEVEDEYGFRYMRKKQKLLATANTLVDEVISTPVPKMVTVKASAVEKTVRSNEAFSPSTPTPSKQILENNRKKRRSSFAATVVQVRNSFGMTSPSLQSQLPPENVKINEYHRHIQTDLPGPVKMRQLMIWACQKASKELSGVDKITSKLVDGLLSNDITTSWYQRPTTSNPSDTCTIYYLPNPQNQELSECIQLYKNYHLKLENECQIWEDLKSKSKEMFKQQVIKNKAALRIDNTLNVFFAEEFQNLSKWLNSLPLSVDRLDWNTKLAQSFQDHAKQFCEGVFHQIFAKFFAADLPQRGGRAQQRIEPMMILRALSANQTITQ